MPKRKKFQRRVKTYAEIIQPEKGEIYFNEETGIYLFTEPSMPLMTYEQLLAKFYVANHELRPISFKLVNDGYGDFEQKDWYAIMYRSWHARIMEGEEKPGPHSCQLWFKSSQMKKAFWIATVQLMFFFYNEEEAIESLLTAIREKEFYLSPKEKDYVIYP